MGEHARSTVAARGVVSARDHASNFRRRKVPQTIWILICWYRWRRSVVRNRTIWHHGRGYGHGRVVVGTRWRVKAGWSRIDSSSVRLGIRDLGMHSGRLSQLVLRCREQFENDRV